MAISRIDSPLKLAGSYIVFGAIWIITSDGLLGWGTGGGSVQRLAHTMKGLGFVGVTAVLLYILTRRLVGRHLTAEMALRDSQQRLSLALDAATQGLYDFNVQTGAVIVNDTFARMLGYDPADFHMDRSRWMDQLHPSDRDQSTRALADYLEGRVADYRVEFRLRTATGDWRWLLSVGRVVEWDEAGRPLRMIGTHTDITDRKSAESRSADALAFARAVLHSSPVGIVAYDPTGQAVIANEAAARIIGTDVAGLLRQNFRELESWRQYGLLADAERAIDTNSAVTLRGAMVTSFGRSIWAEAQFVPFSHEDQRHLLFLLRDETNNHQTQENLRLMETAVQAAPVGWVVTDPQGVVEWVNPGFTVLTGYPPAEIVGRHTRMLKSGRHRPEFYATMWAAVRRGEVWSGEMFNQRKDGGQYHEFMTIAPVRDDSGAIRHFVAIKQDITERKGLEQQLARAQRLESIGLLASGIAHDLNNIFAPILLSLELLKLKYPTADARKTLELIESAGQRGAGIVRQVLTFARGIEGIRTEVQPRYLLKEAAQILSETLPRSVRIEVDCAAGLCSVEGDANQLHQVLLNLAINARDAMPEGGLLSLRARNVMVDDARAVRNPPLKAGPCVAFSVTDTGGGIPDAVLEHMFEPFYTTKPLGKGTGLGLSTVYGIVRSHGGAVEVSTKLGQGTEFTVLLPALDRPVERADTRPPMPVTFSGAGKRVLVVDDEESIRLITVHTLQQHGFTIETAADGVEALALFRENPGRFAIVITDLMMPRLGGRELVREIRRIAPRLPIIASSGLSEEGADAAPGQSLAALGIPTLLRKPYTEIELLSALRRELETE
jgi:PAS domain S-box-containing protein